MKIIKSFKITPNIISKYKSSYLLKIINDDPKAETGQRGTWFLYSFNKYYKIHTFEPLGLVKTTDTETHFDNGQKLVSDNNIYYYGSIDLFFNIKLMIPIEEKEPGPISIEEITTRYNIVKDNPHFQAIYS